MSVFFGPVVAVMVLCVGYLLVRCYVWWIARKIGGVTGDILGSINEGVEIMFVLCMPMLVFI